MFNIIISVITYLITFLLSIVLLPISAILSLITSITGADFSSYYSSILMFVNYALSYIPFFSNLLCIPTSLFLIVLLINVSLLTAYITFKAVALFIKAYRTFKF